MVSARLKSASRNSPRSAGQVAFVAALLLAAQAFGFAYSFTDRATWFSHLNGTGPKQGRYLIADQGRWGYVRLYGTWGISAPPPVRPGGPQPVYAAGHLGAHYTHLPGFVFAMWIHCTWTVVPNVILLGFALRKWLPTRRRERVRGFPISIPVAVANG